MDELIKDLRHCADEGDCNVTCDGCGHFGFKGGCMIKLMQDAADAIEKLEKIIAMQYETIAQLDADLDAAYNH